CAGALRQKRAELGAEGPPDCRFFFRAEDGIRDFHVTGVQTCALPIAWRSPTARFVHVASRYAANRLWERAGLSASDMDVAEVYDGFSWLALCWLEDLGFCAKGEGGPFVAEGNAAIGSTIPTNTHGGSLSGGRLHAISHVIECVEQLRGECGDRQVADAETGIVTSGGGPMAGALLLQRA